MPCHRLLKMRWIVVIAVIDFNNQAVKLQCCSFLLLGYLWGLARAEVLFSFEKQRIYKVIYPQVLA